MTPIYVYEEDTILGFCGYYKGHIKWLFVAPSSRGLVVASKLLQHMVSDLDGEATLTVFKTNERAIKLYIKHGFTVLKEFTIVFQNKKVTVNRMVLSGK